MPSPVAVWSFWVAVCACAAGQVAILRDTLISRKADVPHSGTEPAPAASPGASTRRPGHLHTAGEVIWAILPGIALVFVLLWTWRAIHSDDAAPPVVHAAPTTAAAIP